MLDMFKLFEYKHISGKSSAPKQSSERGRESSRFHDIWVDS